MRTAWKGMFTISSLGSAAKVKAYSVARNTAISLVGIHKDCKLVEREGIHKLEHRKYCQGCMSYVEKEQVGKAYDAGDHLIPISEEEIDATKVTNMVGMTITAFIKREYVNLGLPERSYFIHPDAGSEPFIDAFTMSLMPNKSGHGGRFGVGRLVLQGRIRPAMVESTESGHLMLHILRLTSTLRRPEDVCDREMVADIGHVAMFKKLGKAMEIDKRDWISIEDPYTTRLSELIQSKMKDNSGRLPVVGKSTDKPNPEAVKSLEETLKESLAMLTK